MVGRLWLLTLGFLVVVHGASVLHMAKSGDHLVQASSSAWQGLKTVKVVHEGGEVLCATQGDMLVGPCHETSGGEWVVEPKGRFAASTAHSTPVTQAAIGQTQFWWPNAVIPYVVDPSANRSATEIKLAIIHWEQHTVVRFIPRTTETNYANFTQGSDCQSFVGMVGGGQNVYLLKFGCGTMSVVHEIGHLMGLFHEQSRNDRDTYVTINSTNIQPAYVTNFDKCGPLCTDYGPYDYGSIMHYRLDAFNRNSYNTINVHSAEYNAYAATYGSVTVGQRIGVSKLDVEGINHMYDVCHDHTPEAAPYYTANQWKPCDPSCASPGRKRKVFCHDTQGQCAADSVCTGVTKPIETDPCNGDLNCDFESGTCGWNLGDVGNHFDWIMWTGRTPTGIQAGFTGPNGDHTTGGGFYLYTEASNQIEGNRGFMTSAPVTLPNGTNLTFWYHFYGVTLGTLTLSALPCSGPEEVLVTINTSNTASSKDWRSKTVTFPNGLTSARLRFTGVVGSSFSSDIGLDDISVTYAPGVVPPATLAPTPAPSPRPPTPMPTMAPTPAPTPGPTAPPTAFPTVGPTNAPAACALLNCSGNGLCTAQPGSPGYGCECNLGYSGVDCDIPPTVGLTSSIQTSYNTGQSVVLHLSAGGSVQSVALVLFRNSQCLRNHSGFCSPVKVLTQSATILSNMGTFTWSIPSPIVAPPANDYYIRVWYTTSAFFDTEIFALAGVCPNSACQNGGTCSNGVCQCPSTFTGDTCGTAVDLCQNVSCVSGTCTASTGTCSCTGGATGTYCEVPAGCQLSCSNNGHPNSACSQCVCNPTGSGTSWTGSSCDTCSVPCNSHGTPDSSCIGCVCDAGHTGTNCQIPYAVTTMSLTMDYSGTGLDNAATAAQFSAMLQSNLAAVLSVDVSRVIVASLAPNTVVTLWLTDPDPNATPLTTGNNPQSGAWLVNHLQQLIANTNSNLYTGVVTSFTDPTSTPGGSGGGGPESATAGGLGGGAVAGIVIVVLAVLGVALLLAFHKDSRRKVKQVIDKYTSTDETAHDGFPLEEQHSISDVTPSISTADTQRKLEVARRLSLQMGAHAYQHPSGDGAGAYGQPTTSAAPKLPPRLPPRNAVAAPTTQSAAAAEYVDPSDVAPQGMVAPFAADDAYPTQETNPFGDEEAEPEPAPTGGSDWVQYFDDNNVAYYYNNVTGESTWDAPTDYVPA